MAVAALREKLFGPAKGLAGERWFARPLDGKEMRRWYFPSKYRLQNFRVDEYYEMQAERFAKRPVHESVADFAKVVGMILKNREKVEKFLGQVSHEEFLEFDVVKDLKAIVGLLESTDAADGQAVEVDEGEVAFLLETLRAHSGASVALQVAKRVQVMDLISARKAVLEAIRTGCDTVPAASPTPFDYDSLLTQEERKHLERRHRFVDPLQRRRRLKWMERLLTAKHSSHELKHHGYYKTHADDRDIYPTNIGPATIKWPSPTQ